MQYLISTRSYWLNIKKKSNLFILPSGGHRDLSTPINVMFILTAVRHDGTALEYVVDEEKLGESISTKYDSTYYHLR